jgi:hypothetical protein
MQRIRRSRMAIAGCVTLLTAATALAQTKLDDRQLLRLVGDAVADQGNRGAFRQVLQNYDRYRQLVAEGKIGAPDAEVFDNQLWDRSLRAWDFGDGTPRAETTQPQVQHDYQAPTGGISGLAGKRWQLGVTVVVNGQALGSATYTVTRGRLSDTPINKAGPPPPRIGPPFIPRG